jgi:predicted ATPase
LREEPELRPSAEDILSRLPAVPKTWEVGIELGEPDSLIGRESELRALHDAFDGAARGRPTAVLMHGASGVGKSALARQFIRELEKHESSLVLKGRCYERESIPYKALDSVVDELNHWLRRRPPAERKPLLPAGFSALARIFPVLEHLDFTPQAMEPPAKPDGRNIRLRGFEALSELLVALAAQTPPLVLLIDDLQWGDADSAAFLQHLLSRGGSFPILFVFIYRSDEAQSSPLLKRFLEKNTAVHRINLPVRDLNDAAARELALALLRRESNESPEAAERLVAGIANDSRGNPFLIRELVRYLQATETGATPAPLADLIGLRVARLPETTRRLLEVVALARQPLDLSLAGTASQLESGAYAEVRQLRRGRLVRIRRTEDSEEIEPYHDRIREKVEGSLSREASRQYHQRLALAGESSGKVHPRFLAIHFLGAGSDQPAYNYAIRAAEQAEAVYAYEDAADCYRLASKTTYEASREHVLSQLKLSIALNNAGRPDEGARVYFGLSARAERDHMVRIELDYVLQAEVDPYDRTILEDFSRVFPQSEIEGDEDY